MDIEDYNFDSDNIWELGISSEDSDVIFLLVYDSVSDMILLLVYDSGSDYEVFIFKLVG